MVAAPAANHHALVAKDDVDSKSYIPEYDSREYMKWCNKFTVAAPERVSQIIGGQLTAVRPTTDDDEFLTEEELDTKIKVHNRIYKKYNAILYQRLYQAVGKREDQAGLSIISGPNNDWVHAKDGFQAWQALKLFHQKPTLQNKFLAINGLLNLKQEAKENALAFTIKVEKALSQVKSLNISLDEMAVAVYVNGFLPRYRPSLEAIAVSDTKVDIATISEIIYQFELRQNVATQNESPSALNADDSEVTDKRQKKFKAKKRKFNDRANNAAEEIEDSVANAIYNKLLSKFSDSNAHFANSGTASGKDSGKSKKTVVCFYCKSEGHVIADCYKKKHNDKKFKDNKYGPKSQHNAQQALEKSTRSSAFCAVENIDLGQSLPQPLHFAMSAADTLAKPVFKCFADSGASCHMIPASQADHLVNATSTASTVTTAGGTLDAVATGSLPVQVAAGERTLAVTGLYKSLYSIPTATEGGRIAVLTSKGFSLYESWQVTVHGEPLLYGDKVGNMYEVTLTDHDTAATANDAAMISDVAPTNAAEMWHNRLNHCSNATLKQINKSANGKLFTNANLRDFNRKICPGCVYGKLKMAPLMRHPPPLDTTSDATVTLKPGELILLDLLVSPVESVGGNSYALVILDSATKMAWVKFLRRKSDTVEKMREWLGDVRAQGVRPAAFTTVRTDNGTEFVSAEFRDLCRENSVKFQTAAPYTHVHMVERVIQTLQNSARCNLQNSNMPPRFWADALAYSTYVYNSIPSTGQKQSKQEKWCGVKPDLRAMRTFGSLAYAREYDAVRAKWDARAFRGRFLGYDPVTPGAYRIWKPDIHSAVTTRSVVIDENVHPTDSTDSTSELDQFFLTPVGVSAPAYDQTAATFDAIVDTEAPSSIDPTSGVPQSSENDSAGSQLPAGLDITQRKRKMIDEYLTPNNRISSFTRSRTQRPSSVTTTAPYSVPSPAPERAIYAKVKELNPAKALAAAERTMQAIFRTVRALSAAERTVPRSYAAALKAPDADRWQEAIDAEIASLVKHNVIEVMELDPRVNILGLTWIFKVKETVDGFIERYKARCAALGNDQLPGIDFAETFAPVIRHDTLRFLIAMAVLNEWEIDQMDVITAFLYGLMAGPDVYVKLPPGYPIPAHLRHLPLDRLMGKLRKSLYGIKQAPRLWNETVDKFMREAGFTPSNSDPCLYWREDSSPTGGEGRLYVGIFVDDIVITGSSSASIKAFKSQLSAVFDVKDMGALRYCLGMELSTLPSGKRILSQGKYVTDMLKRFGQLNANSDPIPMDPNVKLSAALAPQSEQEWSKSLKFPYREVVGSLMYLMICTRPDISYAVTQLSKFLNCHGPIHHAAAIRVLRYVKGTRDYGLIYSPASHLTSAPNSGEVYGYSDSSHADDVDTRRSTTGYVFFFAGGPITWKTKTQPTVALSSTEAEYMALGAASCEALSLRYMQEDFGVAPSRPTLIYEDNQGAIAMAANPVHFKTTKHIHYKYHFIRDCVSFGDVHIEYITTHEMIADTLTKALAKVTFLNLRKFLVGCAGKSE